MTYGKQKAAFKVGQKLEYLGDSKWSREGPGGKMIPTRFKGMIVDVIEVKPPEKGIGFIRNDEDGDPIIDHDQNGCNVAITEHGDKFLIWPENKNQWRIL